MPRSDGARRKVSVAIVSNNPETIDGLQSYLARAGVSSHGTGAVSDLERVAPPSVTAAVIFPDDFAEREILELIRSLGAARPGLLALLVTRDPRRFRSAVDAAETPPTSMILPKPSFGWDILDAIRAHAAGAGT